MALTSLAQQSPIPGVEIIDRDEDHVVVVFGNMVFVYWHKETRKAAFRRVRSKLTELAASHKEGVGVCQVIGPLATPPDAETRAEITHLIKESVEGNLKHYSVVYEGTGFKAASIRAVLSASQMMARSKTKVAVFSTIVEGADWHARRQQALGKNESARRLEQLMAWLRDSYSVQATALER